MDKDSAAGPDMTGVRWLLIVATNDLRDRSDLSGLQRMTLVVRKIAAGDLSALVRNLLSPANLIPLEKGEARVGPITIGIFLRRLSTRALVHKATAEAKDYLCPPQL